MRDLRLLMSALGTPSTFDGLFLHNDLFDMAAAYLYHIARNHPFVDGNKRTAFATALVFLRLNGLALIAGDDEVTDLILKLRGQRADET